MQNQDNAKNQDRDILDILEDLKNAVSALEVDAPFYLSGNKMLSGEDRKVVALADIKNARQSLDIVESLINPTPVSDDVK